MNCVLGFIVILIMNVAEIVAISVPLFIASSFSMKVHVAEVLTGKLMIMALDFTKNTPPLIDRLKKAFKKNPQAATRGMYSGLSYYTSPIPKPKVNL